MTDIKITTISWPLYVGHEIILVNCRKEADIGMRLTIKEITPEGYIVPAEHPDWYISPSEVCKVSYSFKKEASDPCALNEVKSS